MKIETIGKKITKADLVKVATDPKLENFMIVCFFDDNTTSTGWGDDLRGSDAALGLVKMQQAIMKTFDF